MLLRDSTGRSSLSARRAWIEIDVIRPAIDVFLASLSARRAWIEINYKEVLYMGVTVALRKESVDRNTQLYLALSHVRCVALRKESVDRNRAIHDTQINKHSRSPQGERG